MIHKLTNINIIEKTANCSACNKKVKIRSNGRKERMWRCNEKDRSGEFSKVYSKYRKFFCERCGFVAEHKIQLDVHHIDFNHKNNSPENLKTLCANCHRLYSLSIGKRHLLRID